jgi:plastocyanin
MSRGPSAPIACCALALVALAAGCGSSNGSSTGSAPTAAGASGASGGHGGIKVTGTPRFASPPANAPVQSGTVHVAYRNITIQPDTLKVKVGTTVVWTNYDSVEENVVSEGGPQKFASGTFGEGQSFSVKLTKPGVVHYECTIHPTTMNGTIEVVG